MSIAALTNLSILVNVNKKSFSLEIVYPYPFKAISTTSYCTTSYSLPFDCLFCIYFYILFKVYELRWCQICEQTNKMIDISLKTIQWKKIIQLSSLWLTSLNLIEVSEIWLWKIWQDVLKRQVISWQKAEKVSTSSGYFIEVIFWRFP